MTAAELERFLLSSMCDVRFRAPLENYLLAGWMGHRALVCAPSDRFHAQSGMFGERQWPPAWSIVQFKVPRGSERTLSSLGF